MKRLLVLAFLVLITFLMVNKGLDLWSLQSNVDGAGIGVYFLGIEINDRVPVASIPSYAVGFLLASLIIALLTTVYAWKTTKRNFYTKGERL